MNRNTKQLERLWLWFFPRRCVWCMGATAPAELLCPDCEAEAEPHRVAPSTLPGTDIPLVCVFPYHSRASRILLNMKFHGGRKYAHSVGYAMADALSAAGFADKPGELLFCCVPMTPAKVKQRGYNQSELIAGAAARWLGADFAPGMLLKTRETEQQRGLHASQREANVAGAYAADRAGRLAGRRVVLCDDICTTGATLRSCAQVLRDAGAGELVCLTYLRTEENKGHDQA